MLSSQSSTSLSARQAATIHTIGTENGEQTSFSSNIENVKNIPLVEISFLPRSSEVNINFVNHSRSGNESLLMDELGNHQPMMDSITNNSCHCENLGDESNNGMIKARRNIVINNESELSRGGTSAGVNLFSLPERTLSDETEIRPVKSSRPGRFKRFLSHIGIIHSDVPPSGNSESLAQTKRANSPEKKDKVSQPRSKSPETHNSPMMSWRQETPISGPRPERTLSNETEIRPVKSSRPGRFKRFLSHIGIIHSDVPPSGNAESLARTKRASSPVKNAKKNQPDSKSPGTNDSSVMAWLRPTSISRPQPEQVSWNELIPILKNVSITVANEKYSGPQSILESQWYADLSSEFDQKKLSELLSYYSNNESFLSKEHLRDIVNHDIDFFPAGVISGKSAQDQFLTKNGWIDKLKQYDMVNKTKFFASTQMGTFWKNYKFSPLKEPLKYVDVALKKVTGSEQVNLYRTMSYEEAKDILLNRNFDSLGGHLGDFREALSYLHRGTGGKVTLEFPLKPGVHELLFSPDFSAIQGAGKITSIIAKVAELNKQGFFPKGSKNEGSAAGYTGIKSEATGESGLSISISDKQSRKLFEKFVDIPDIKVVSFRG